MTRFARFVLLSTILVSCQEKKTDTAQLPSARRGPYHIVKYQRHSQTCLSPDSLCATAKLIYPVYHDPARAALNDSIRADVAAYSGVANPELPRPTDPQVLAREFTGNFDAFVRSQQGQPFYGNVWALDVTAKPLRQTPTYFALQIDAYAYEGGAHGNYSTYFVNYDPRTAQRIRLTDLIRADAGEALRALAEELFRKQEGLQPNQKLDGDYFFENGRFRLNDNFTLTDAGLRFLYNPYEIKPYAAGQTTLDLPWAALRPLLKPGAPGV